MVHSEVFDVNDSSIHLLQACVALTGCSLQAFAVEHAEFAAAIGDQARSLQGAGDNGHCLTANAQQLAQEFVSYEKLVLPDSIVGH
jgi:hypothetical protein